MSFKIKFALWFAAVAIAFIMIIEAVRAILWLGWALGCKM